MSDGPDTLQATAPEAPYFPSRYRKPRTDCQLSSTALRRLGSLDSDVLCHDAPAISERMGVAEVTAREWRRLGRVPHMWLRAARALLLGEIGVIDKAFAGWTIRDGHICAPENGDYQFSPGDIRYMAHARSALVRMEFELQDRAKRIAEETAVAIAAKQREHDAQVEALKRRHADALAALRVPYQGDWVEGTFTPAPALAPPPELPPVQYQREDARAPYLRARRG